MYLKEKKLTDIDPAKMHHILVPIGSTEQHGPYLPFGTDTYMTDDVVREMEKSFPELLIAPTLEYSCSREHEGFQGTLWLSEETLKAILRDVCESFRSIAKGIGFFSGHGGNLHVIDSFIVEQHAAYVRTEIGERLFQVMVETARRSLADFIEEK